MSTLTMKFGGRSVATTTALTQVISIVLQEHERWERLIVVASALEGVTHALLEAAHLAQLSNQRGYRRIVATIRARHLALVEQLPLSTDERNVLNADIDQLLFEMLDFCQTLADTPAEGTPALDKVDAIIGVGERLAARIIAALLRESNLRGVALDTTQLVITDDTFGNAVPDFDATRERVARDLLPMLSRQIIPVVTGFIGGTLDGRPTTLGRGGSDYTASIIGVCTHSDEIWMWTDVDGMMSADPKEVEDSHVIPAMSYNEIAELAYFGAKILHAHMVTPLREHSIPLRVKNVFKPQAPGTIVQNAVTSGTYPVKAVTMINGVSLRAERSTPLTAISALVNEAFLESIGSPADVMISAQSVNASFLAFIVPTNAGLDASRTVYNTLKQALESTPDVGEWRLSPVGVLSAIGTDINQHPRVIAQIFHVLEDIPILAMAQGPSHCSVSVVVPKDRAELALHRIHQLTHA